MGSIWLTYGLDMALIWLSLKFYGNFMGGIEEYSTSVWIVIENAYRLIIIKVQHIFVVARMYK